MLYFKENKISNEEIVVIIIFDGIEHLNRKSKDEKGNDVDIMDFFNDKD